MEVANANADKSLHGVTNGLKHAAHLPIQPLLQDDPQPSWADWLQTRQSRALAVEKHSLHKFLTQLWVPVPIERDLILLLNLVARMGEMLREVTVARQKKQTLGLRVEAADVEKTREFCRQQIVNRVGCIRIAPGGNEPGRFVQSDGESFGRSDQPVINFDVITFLNLRPEISTRLAVDRNTARCDQLVTMATRTKPSGGEETIETHAVRNCESRFENRYIGTRFTILVLTIHEPRDPASFSASR